MSAGRWQVVRVLNDGGPTHEPIVSVDSTHRTEEAARAEVARRQRRYQREAVGGERSTSWLPLDVREVSR